MEVFSIAKGFYKLSKDSPPELSQKDLERDEGCEAGV
jgi:hypothetical protein